MATAEETFMCIQCVLNAVQDQTAAQPASVAHLAFGLLQRLDSLRKPNELTLNVLALLTAPTLAPWEKKLVDHAARDQNGALVVGSIGHIEWFRGRFIRDALEAVASGTIRGPSDYERIVATFADIPPLEEHELLAYAAAYAPRGAYGLGTNVLGVIARKEQRDVFGVVLRHLFLAMNKEG